MDRSPLDILDNIELMIEAGIVPYDELEAMRAYLTDPWRS